VVGLSRQTETEQGKKAEPPYRLPGHCHHLCHPLIGHCARPALTSSHFSMGMACAAVASE